MEQATNDPPKRRPHGGDTRTPQAKLEVARREQQIVALRLRGVPFFEIGRVIGISRVSAFRAFRKALRRATEQDLKSHHRAELAELEMEKANIWRSMDANKENWQAQMSGSAQLRGIHVRRAKLLGLDAPTKFDVRALYGAGTDEISERRLENQRAWARLSLEEQERIYEALTRPAIDTTATVTSGPDNRNTDASLLRRTRNLSRPNPRAAQSDLAGGRVVLWNSLRLYIRHAWHVVEPSTVYLENWYIDLIAEAVDDLSGKLAYRP